MPTPSTFSWRPSKADRDLADKFYATYIAKGLKLGDAVREAIALWCQSDRPERAAHTTLRNAHGCTQPLEPIQADQLEKSAHACVQPPQPIPQPLDFEQMLADLSEI